MPYRRLPNTDQARIRALKAVAHSVPRLPATDADNRSLFRGFAIRCLLWYMGNSKKRSARYTIADSRIGVPCRS